MVRYVNAGRDLSCEATSLRDRQYLQDQLDVFNILRGLDSLMDDFDIRSKSRTEEQPVQPRMNRKMKSMAKMYDLGTSFWHLCLTDIPWQLGEGTRTSLLDADLGINPASTIVQDQFLSRHPSYENAVLVRSLFQCYQRTGQHILFNSNGTQAYLTTYRLRANNVPARWCQLPQQVQFARNSIPAGYKSRKRPPIFHPVLHAEVPSDWNCAMADQVYGVVCSRASYSATYNALPFVLERPSARHPKCLCACCPGTGKIHYPLGGVANDGASCMAMYVMRMLV